MRHIELAAIGMILAAAGVASAAETASATISQTGTTGVNFDYSIVLKDTGTTNIGTFWYSWVPGQDYMKSSPTVTPPAGWSAANITHGGASDGYAIQWIASTPLTPGNSQTFTFESPDNFATMTGDSFYYPSTPVGTSFIYSGGPFSDGGDEFVVAAPEPAGMGLLGAAGVLALKRRRRNI